MRRDDDDPEGLTELTTFGEDLRTAFPEPRVDDSMRHMHLAAIAEAARSNAAETGSPVTARVATHPTSRRLIPRRRPVFKSLAAKITAVAVIAFASLGGLATAGALPRPVQHGVARVANSVGINIPDPEDNQSGDQSGPNDQSGDQGTSGDTTGPSGPSGSTGSSGDQGTSGDNNDQSGDTNDQSGDQSGPNDQSGDQGTSGDTTDQAGNNSEQTDQSGDQGTSGDTNDQSGDQSGSSDQSGDQGTSSNGSDGSGGQSGGDQGGQ